MPREIDPQAFLERLKSEELSSKAGGQEGAHGEADSILCELLELLGYKDVVAAYNKVEKWYA